jgi:hypothetical protein
MPFIVGLSKKQKTSLMGSKTYHPNACTFKEHAHPPYAHIVFQMSFSN